MTPAGTSNELDVQNGWEENTHTHIMQEADLARGIRGTHEAHETVKVRDIRRTGGGRGLRGGTGTRADGVFPGRRQSFRHQRRPVDDCSPGRGGMAQDGETRGGTFRGEIDHCRESQGWTTV